MSNALIEPNPLNASPTPKKPPARSQSESDGVSQGVVKLLYSRKEAAFALGISIRALDYLLSRESIKARRMGSRVLIHRDDLVKWAARDHLDSVAA